LGGSYPHKANPEHPEDLPCDTLRKSSPQKKSSRKIKSSIHQLKKKVPEKKKVPAKKTVPEKKVPEIFFYCFGIYTKK
jgi:hypothetical protein